MDQLCIDQSNNKEKEKEVPKMRRYYSNAVITLISTNANTTPNESKKEFVVETINTSLSAYSKTAKSIHHEIKHNSKDKASLRLNEALQAIRKRGRSIPLDGIYSILGLLPYGKQVRVNYSENNTPQDVLSEIMKLSIQEEGYNENGSTNIKMTIKINCEPESNKFTANGVKLIGSKHVINCLVDSFHTKGKKEKYRIYSEDEDNGILAVEDTINNKFWLEGAKETLERIKKGDIVFAILVPNKGNPDCPIDIVPLHESSGKERTYEEMEKELFIDMINKEVIEEINQQEDEAENKLEEEIQVVTDNQQDEIQAQQEVPPKSSN
ncbi:9473_t:CDS:2 [Ambispora gerdemannii]|uniref:9473_t:CDS:1 n=1 Tax=Ambispora gerdemannii TaxID=144530 RepID=A0A9N9DY13_9GLOM|nr:9473_t:CDS:2 [Ambispora gerdemannii]